jgi:hypothetical protein
MVIATRARVAVGFAVAVVIAGCGSSGQSADPSASAPAPQASAPASASAQPGSLAGAAGCDNTPWHSGAITVTHKVSASPVPVIAAVRVAQHPECRYDRIVLDIRGAIPSYSVQYVSSVIADASGQVITMPGARHLVITLRPAQAHTGVPTVATGVHALGYPALASWALAGDFEGVVKIALGLAAPTSIRTGELGGRIYVDVRE